LNYAYVGDGVFIWEGWGRTLRMTKGVKYQDLADWFVMEVSLTLESHQQ
jgi:hypothetical protein